MCQQCSWLGDRRELRTPSQYFKLLAQLKELVREQILDLFSGPPMEDIQEGQPWPADVLSHVFRCTGCGQKFALAVDTYHGAGSWHPQ
jgi:hypothetical protein